MTRQRESEKKKKKRGDKKEESNDSPEIPDRGFQQTSPASLRGERRKNSKRQNEKEKTTESSKQTVTSGTKRKGRQKVVNKQ